MKLAVYFPGIGYHCDKPLLYYARKVASEKGFDNYLNIEYTFKGQNIRGDHKKMQEAFESLYAQAKKSLALVEWEKYDEILFVSKSIGTIIASAYAKEYKIPNLKHILYTPLEQTFDFEPQNAVAFIGTKDPWSDFYAIKRSANVKKIPLEVYENCNHSLECEDTLRNIDILANVIKKSKEYM